MLRLEGLHLEQQNMNLGVHFTGIYHKAGRIFMFLDTEQPPQFETSDARVGNVCFRDRSQPG